MDLIHAHVSIEAFRLQVAKALDTHIDEYKQMIMSEIEEQLAALDIKSIIRGQIERELHDVTLSLVKSAFRGSWELESELKVAIKNMLLVHLRETR